MEIKVNLEQMQELQGMLAKAPEIADRHLHKALHEALSLLQGQVIEATPTGAHQLLRRVSMDISVSESGYLGVVGTSAPYAIPVELGTKPHFPWDKTTKSVPYSLVDWVVNKLGVDRKKAGGVAYLIARKISKKGTQGAFMFRDTFKRLEPAVNAIFAEARQAILADMIRAGK